MGVFVHLARWSLRALLALALAWSPAAGWAARALDVLVLHSYSQEYAWTKGQHEGFLDGLAQDAGQRYEVRAEYLDTKRVRYDEAYAEQFAQTLAAKYRGYTPEAIYVSDDHALRFALAQLPALFPDAPVFFSGVNDLGVRARLDPTRVSGAFERKQIAPNLELVRAFAGRDAALLIVGDDSPTARAIEHELHQELAALPPLRARFVAERRLDRLLAQIDGASERFVVLTTLGALTDEQGAPLPLAHSLAAIAARPGKRVLSMEDAYVREGVLGGWVTSAHAQGRAAAVLLTRHLGGTPLAALAPLIDSPNEYLFDEQALRASGLRLPAAVAAQARLLNPRPGFVQRHQRVIVLALFALAGALIGALGFALAVVQRKKRLGAAHAVALQAQAEDIARTHERLVRGQRIAALGNWEWDLEHEHVHWSDEVFRIFGIEQTLRPAGFATFIACVHPQDRPQVRAALRRCLEQGLPYRLTHRVLRPDGSERIVDENAELTRDASGRPLRLIGTVMDVTEREQALRALHRSEETLRRVIEGLPVVLWMLDAEGRFLLSEGRGLQLMGRRPGEALGESLFERYAELPQIVADTRRVLGGEDFACVWQLGSLWFETRYSPLRDACGQVSGAIGVAMDITERKLSEDRLAYLASYDTVTGLPNRSLFQDRLAQALHRAERDSRQAALLFIDLDNFKHVNDTLGHAAGDALLQQVAARLKGALRASDSVSRLGGDEFTVILEAVWRDEDVEQVADKLLQESALPYRLQGHEVFVTASIGIAVYPRDGDNAEALLMSADAAMYRAKDRGRHGYEFFAQAISARSQERLSLGNELRGALARGEFSLHYQPKAALQGGRVLGFEALLRWHNARLGAVSPAVFIPVLEDTGLIAEVGAWVLAEACRWAAQAPPAGARPTTVSVNLSARQFRDPALDSVVQRALDGAGLAPGRLELELTESILVDLEGSLQTMTRLKALGIKLAIDDFGTGYSSLSYLKRFPVDRLKIDASFVRDIASDPDDAAIVAAIVGMGHHLQLRVIAEGVETAAQLEFLRRQGCDEVQGYLLGRPMPGDEARRWLGAHANADAGHVGTDSLDSATRPQPALTDGG